MKDNEIKLNEFVYHIESGVDLYVEFYHEGNKLWVGTCPDDETYFFEAEDVCSIDEADNALHNEINAEVNFKEL